jgi:hypothetical protein
MFRTKLLNSFKTVANKIYERVYNRTYEHINFDTNFSIILGILIGSGIGSYKAIEFHKGKINKTENVITTLSLAICGGIIGGGFGCVCGYLYPYGIVVLPSTIMSYGIYHNSTKEIILDDLCLTQKSIT